MYWKLWKMPCGKITCPMRSQVQTRINLFTRKMIQYAKTFYFHSYYRFVKQPVLIIARHAQTGVKHVVHILNVKKNVEIYALHAKRFEIKR